MAARVWAGIQRWTWKTIHLKAVPVLETPRMPFPSHHRWFFSAQQDPLAPPQIVQHHDGEITKQSLADMGFTGSQAEVVYEGATKHRSKQDMLTVLFGLGFNPESVLKILETCPVLYSVKEAQLQQRITNLRKLGLLEGSLQRVISHYPRILTLPVKRVNAVSRLLREKCKFNSQQVASILRDSPHVVEEEPDRLEYMFQYVYFRMGCRQAEMVKSKLFRLTLEELRCRHSFLERRGLYQTPDKKGQTLVLNPNLKDVLTVTEETFLTKVAAATQEEFDVFRKLSERELEEEDEQGEEYSSDNDGGGEGEEADVRTHKRSRDAGYQKRKNSRKEN